MAHREWLIRNGSLESARRGAGLHADDGFSAIGTRFVQNGTTLAPDLLALLFSIVSSSLDLDEAGTDSTDAVVGM